MFYWLIELSNTVPGFGIFRGLFNVFRYITFRPTAGGSTGRSGRGPRWPSRCRCSPSSTARSSTRNWPDWNGVDRLLVGMTGKIEMSTSHCLTTAAGRSASGASMSGARGTDGFRGASFPPPPERLPVEALDSHCHLDLMDGAGADAGRPRGPLGIRRMMTVGGDLACSAGARCHCRAPGRVRGVAIHPNEATGVTEEVSRRSPSWRPSRMSARWVRPDWTTTATGARWPRSTGSSAGTSTIAKETGGPGHP